MVGLSESNHHTMTMTPIRLLDLFKYYQEKPHQMAALVALEQQLLKADPTAFDRDKDSTLLKRKAWFGLSPEGRSRRYRGTTKRCLMTPL